LATNQGGHSAGQGWSVDSGAGAGFNTHYSGGTVGWQPLAQGQGQPAYKRLDKEAQLVEKVNNLTAQVVPHL